MAIMIEKKLFKDLKDTERDAEHDHLSAQAEVTGLGMWDTPGMIFSEDLKSVYGICAECAQFFYCRQSYQNKRAWCDRFNTLLMGKDRMIECNKFEKRGQLNLNQMADIAWIIERPGRKVGF